VSRVVSAVRVSATVVSGAGAGTYPCTEVSTGMDVSTGTEVSAAAWAATIGAGLGRFLRPGLLTRPGVESARATCCSTGETGCSPLEERDTEVSRRTIVSGRVRSGRSLSASDLASRRSLPSKHAASTVRPARINRRCFIVPPARGRGSLHQSFTRREPVLWGGSRIGRELEPVTPLCRRTC
jgi:hypothetical protein